MIGIIGGSGLNTFENIEDIKSKKIDTVYGEPSSALTTGTLHNHSIVFLARHGTPHSIPPHKINYRANIDALKQLGVTKIIAVAAVGGITSRMHPGALVIPDQIIDYTWSREHTFFDGGASVVYKGVQHIDFTDPYTLDIRMQLIKTANEEKLKVVDRGVYAATQGPRLETAREIKKLAYDGCDIVGMTGMPEASLAREAGLDYACCAVVANWAAGREAGIISMEEIEKNLSVSMDKVYRLITGYVRTTD